MAIIKKEDFGGGGTGLTLGSWNYDSNTDAPGTTPIADNTWRTDAALGISTKLYIDDNDDDGTDWGAKLNVPDGSWISFSIDSSNQVHFKVQNATDGSGYWDYDILGIVVEGTIGNGAATSVKIDVGEDNSPNDLGTFSPSNINLNSIGYYDDYDPSGNITITFTGTPVGGSWRRVTVTLIAGESITCPVGSRCFGFTSGSAPGAGTYDFFIWHDGDSYNFNLTSPNVVPADTTAPTLSNFSIPDANPDRINFESSEIITGTTFGGFTISTGQTITAININAGQTTGHYFTVDSAFDEADGTPTIAYSGTGCDIQDAGSNALASFTATNITNNVVDPPSFVSAEVGGVADNILVVVYDRAVNATTAGHNIDTDGAALSISSIDSGSGTTTINFQLSRSVLDTETLNYDYDQGTGDTLAVANSKELNTVTDGSVTNNVAGLTQLNAPTLDSLVVDSSTEITANWTDNNSSPNEDGNRAIISDDSGFSNIVESADLAADVVTYQFTGLTESTPYWVKIIALGDGVTTSDSPDSNIESETTLLNSFDPNSLNPVFFNQTEIIFDGETFIDSGIYNDYAINDYWHIFCKLSLADGRPNTVEVFWGASTGTVQELIQDGIGTSGTVRSAFRNQLKESSVVFTNGLNPAATIHLHRTPSTFIIEVDGVEYYNSASPNVNANIQSSQTIYYGCQNTEGVPFANINGVGYGIFVWGGSSDLSAQNITDLETFFNGL